MSTDNATSEIDRFIGSFAEKSAERKKWEKGVSYRRSKGRSDESIWHWITGETFEQKVISQISSEPERVSPVFGETVEQQHHSIVLTGTDQISGIVLQRAARFRNPNNQTLEQKAISQISSEPERVSPDSGETLEQKVISQISSEPERVSPASALSYSFKVYNPTVFDASKPAWKFCETSSEPERVSPAFGETLEQKAISQTSSEPERVSPASGETLEQKAISQKPLDLVEWLQVNLGLYAVSRLILYTVIIAISRQPVDSLFQALDIFGTQAINSAAALIVTVTTDLIAMNLFGRAVDSFWHRQNHKIEAGLCFLVPAIAIVAANIWLTQESLRSKAKISVNQLAETQWIKDLTEAKTKLGESETIYSNAYGAFLAKKWTGAVNPEACESGQASCTGPYSSRAAEQQSAFIAAKSAKDIAQAAYERLESKRPTIKNTQSEEAGVSQKLVVYLVLWAGILLTYIYQPRKSLAL